MQVTPVQIIMASVAVLSALSKAGEETSDGGRTITWKEFIEVLTSGLSAIFPLGSITLKEK